jgi:magnesium transporter
MPLNLVTGIYGMNFEHMPELKWTWGYAFAISLLVFIALGIAYFFYYKGYFKRHRAD